MHTDASIKEHFERLNQLLSDWTKLEETLKKENTLPIPDGLIYHYTSINSAYDRHEELTEQGRLSTPFLVKNHAHKIRIGNILRPFFNEQRELVTLFLQTINKNSKGFRKVGSKQIPSDFFKFIQWIYSEAKEDDFVSGFVDFLKEASYHWILIRFVRNSLKEDKCKVDSFLENNNLKAIVITQKNIEASKLLNYVESHVLEKGWKKADFQKVEVTKYLMNMLMELHGEFYRQIRSNLSSNKTW